MTTRGHIFGHLCYWDEEAEVYRYADDDSVAHLWGGEPRPCPECNQMPTPEGFDPCIGFIPGASNACCGHGVKKGYVQWPAVKAREANEPYKVTLPYVVLLYLTRKAGFRNGEGFTPEDIAQISALYESQQAADD